LAVDIANATFAVRQRTLWGAGSTAVASDSTHFGAWDQNLFTEWHSRYRGRGVLIYWHVERKSMVVHSQLLSCTASEVAAMVDGAMHHGTEMDVRSNYVDTHGHVVIWTPRAPLLHAGGLRRRPPGRWRRWSCGSGSAAVRRARTASNCSTRTAS
jgi:TnpA family transposase